MPFGQQVGTVKKLKEGLKGSGPLKFIPKEGNIMVRFLEEPNKWLRYFEVFDTVRNVGWPVPDDESAPGYPDPDMRKSKRYLASVVDISRDEVVALQLPTSLVNDLVVRYDRYETITDRDYELFRTGSGLDTSYGLTPEPASKRNMAKYKTLDLEDCLQQAYDAVWADGDGDIDEDTDDEPIIPPRSTRTARKAPAAPAPAKKASAATKKAAAKPAPEPEPEDVIELGHMADDDGLDAAAQRLTELAQAAGLDPDIYETWSALAEALDAGDEPLVDTDDAFGDDDPTDDMPAGDDDDDDSDDSDLDSDTYSRDELTAMSMEDLRTLARDNGIVTKGLAKSEVVDSLMGA